MLKLVECSDCEGVGLKEDRRGNTKPCSSCKGKGTLYEPENPSGRPSSPKEKEEV